MQKEVGSPKANFSSCIFFLLFLHASACHLLSEFSRSEVILLSGTSVNFIMVSLPEPKYKNAGGPDDMFSREDRGAGRRSHAHSLREHL